MASNGNLVPRHKVLAFYSVPVGQSGESFIWKRMHFFTELTHSKNPEEYERKYVDEASKRTDIVAYAPSFSYAFDRHRGDMVQNDIIDIGNREKLGEDAIRQIALIDVSAGTQNATGYYRRYSVVPDSEGDDENTYTHSGEFKAAGELLQGSFTSSDDWETVTLSE